MNGNSFQREIQNARSWNRHQRFQGVASFECLNERCAVTRLDIHFAETPGGPVLQWGLACPRCKGLLQRFIGLEVRK